MPAYSRHLDNPSIVNEHLTIDSGDEACLNRYFHSLNTLSRNQVHYQQYKDAFARSYSAAPRNPLARKVSGCDYHLVQHPSINRDPLVVFSKFTEAKKRYDTFEVAMKLLHNEVNLN